MKSLIVFLMIWINAETGYNTDLPVPTVKMVSEQTLVEMYYGNSKPDSEVHALYDTKSETIYVKDTFNVYNVWDKGILLHELLHYVHDKNNVVGTKFRCLAQSEAEIYPLQKKYLLEVHGVKWDYDPMYLKVISSCDKTR